MTSDAGLAETFIPLHDFPVASANDFEFLFSIQEKEVFSQIDRALNLAPDLQSPQLAAAVPGTSAQGSRSEAEDAAWTRDTENAVLKEKLQELAAEVEALKATECKRYEQSIDAEISTLRQSFSNVCDGLQTAVTIEICQEIARILEPFLEQTLLRVTLSVLESEISKVFGGNSEDFFVLSGSKAAVDKFAPLLEGNKFRFKLNISDSSEVTVEYKNQLLTTRFDYWGRLLSQGLPQ